MGEENCVGCHDEHLCVFSGKKNFDHIRSLVKNPAFICYNCGRVADAKENLCNPVPLDKTNS